jgi:hypothetical protein
MGEAVLGGCHRVVWGVYRRDAWLGAGEERIGDLGHRRRSACGPQVWEVICRRCNAAHLVVAKVLDQWF